MRESNRSQREEDKEKEATDEDKNDPITYAEFISTTGWEEIPGNEFTVLATSEAFQIKKLIYLREEELNDVKKKLKTKTENIFGIADSGSTFSF